MSIIGPSLPPHLRKSQSEDSNSEEEDLYGPALPPHLLKAKDDTVNKGNNEEINEEDHSDEVSTSKPNEASEDEESDGEIVGPLPVGESGSSALYSSAAELERRALRMKKKLLGQEEHEEKEPEREEWMLELPELKKKNFGLGPRSFNRTDKPEITGRDQWTSVSGSEVLNN